jgi:hypothetical protein
MIAIKNTMNNTMNNTSLYQTAASQPSLSVVFTEPPQQAFGLLSEFVVSSPQESWHPHRKVVGKLPDVLNPIPTVANISFFTAKSLFTMNNLYTNTNPTFMSNSFTSPLSIIDNSYNRCLATRFLLALILLMTLSVISFGQVTNAGTISGDETNCAVYNPELITSIEDGTGTCAISSTDNCCEEHGNHNHADVLVLRYVGSQSPVNITVQSNFQGDQTSYSATHQNNDIITIEADDRLGTNTDFSVGNRDFELHTSCSNGGIDAGQGINSSGNLVNNPNPSAGNIIFIVVGVGTPDGCREGLVSSGGNTGVFYQWEYRLLGGNWISIPGATSSTYDPPSTIVETTQYRRLANCDSAVGSSNIVTKSIDSDIGAGQIGSDESLCGGYDPEIINSIVDATGSCTTTVISPTDCCEEHGDHNHASTLILRYVGPQSPVNITVESEFEGDDTFYSATHQNGDVFTIQANDRLGADTYFSVGNRDFTVHTSCSSGGIDAGQGIRDNGDLVNNPNPGASNIIFIVVGVGTPDGCTEGTSGSVNGDVSYQWQSRKGTSGGFQNILGARGASFNPTFIFETTQYRRIAECGDCGTEASNIVTKAVGILPESKIVTSPTTLCEGESGSFSAADCTGSVAQQTDFAYISRITASANDSWQDDGHNYPGNYEDDDIDFRGFRFVNLNIPAGAIITSANLVLTGYDGDASNLTLKAFRQFAPPAYTNATNHLSSLYNNNSTSSLQTWSIPGPDNGDLISSPDFSNVLQELVNEFGGVAHVSLLLRSSDDFTVWNFDDGSSNANKRPLLNVTYSTFEETESEVSCSYKWDFPGGTPSTSTEQFPTVIWSTPGVKTVTLTVNGGSVGCETIYIAATTVIASPSATAVANNATCGQDNGSITFTFADEPSQSSIEFSIDGGATYLPQVADNIGSTTVSNLPAGIYDLRTRWENDACPVDIPSVTIGTNSGPTANAGSDQTTCAGDNADLLASAFGGTAPLT